MSTAQLAATLFQLQQLDLDIERLLAEQQAVSKSLQGSLRAQRIQQEYDTGQRRLQGSLREQKEAEGVLEDLARRLAAQVQRLYSGVVTHPKELHALQQEVQYLRAQQSQQEDRVLAAIDAVETQQAAQRRKAEELREAAESWARESATGGVRRDQLEARKEELQSRRARLISGIDAVHLQRYETLRRTKQGKAISKVEQNSCQWCRVILTPSELQHVRTSSELQTCTNCGRILYYTR
jgi:uncharacterized protein